MPTPDATLSTPTLAQAVEAILMTSEKPLPVSAMVEPLARAGIEADAPAIEVAVDSINERFEQSQSAARIERVGKGFRLMTHPSLAGVLQAFHGSRSSTKLSKAALETLAIVAYRQPITRAEVESIRGVAAGEVIRSLLERRLITVTGRAEELGRPMLYGTTPAFLETFGLGGVADLPSIEGVSA
ncbi:MAG: SMC-Scp complex subunit ScpB [Planctomycetota bacterium]